MKKRSLSTLLAQAGHFVDGVTGAVTPPIHPSTTFARGDDYELIGDYTYSRDQNPTYDQVEHLIAELDNGAEARLFSSGMAAITAVFATVNMGQHIVAPTIMYHGAQDWLRRIGEKSDIGLTLFDATDPNGLRQAIKPGKTAIVWIETPVNPTWDVIDIADSAEAAHDAGAILGVDCTVSTPITTRALDLGADLGLELQKLVVAPSFDLHRHIVGEPAHGRRAWPRGVLENEVVLEPHPPQQRLRQLEVLLGLRREAHDDVARQTDVR
ncbi:PLP-dependent transferase, partial [candidate division KSB1 bacterium]|nr:PLP-dependent transferase [candidate division KSB1 bacterium]